MKNIKNKFIPLSISILAILSLSFFGCMDLFDDGEVEILFKGIGSGINVAYDESAEADLITYVVSEDKITFTGKEGYSTYKWYNGTKASEFVCDEQVYEWSTKNDPDGNYPIVLVVTDSEGNSKSATVIVVLHK